jgi:transcriptional regulator with XRE-family HTH domain
VQLGKNIELLRSQIHYMTQRALAEAAGFGLSDCHISDLEKGSRSARSITIEQLRSIAQELGGRLIVQWQDETQKVRYNNKTPIGILFRKGATILILR